MMDMNQLLKMGLVVAVILLLVDKFRPFLNKVGAKGWRRTRRRGANKGYRLNTSDMDFEKDQRGKTIRMNLPPTHMLANGERRTNPSVLHLGSGRLDADDIVVE